MNRDLRPANRRLVLAQEREAEAADAESVREEVKAFMRQPSQNVMKFLITLRKDGRPHCRPVGTFVEGWTVGTISQGEHLKNTHIRNNPEVGYLWVERNPQGEWPRSVYMSGRCEIIDDQEVVAEFFKRRKAVTGQGDGHPDEEWTRLLLRTTPTMVRAEGFLGPRKPALFRDFSK